MQEKHVHDLRNKETEFKTEMAMTQAQLTERIENLKKFMDESSSLSREKSEMSNLIQKQ